MAKFVNSEESISSSLLLWSSRPTQVSIEDTYTLKVWPVTNIYNHDGPINFNIPPQSKGMLDEVFIITKVKIQKNGCDLEKADRNVSVINNFTNSMWAQLDCQIGTRTDITQSMRNSYAYSSFFNHILNSESNRKDYMYYTELFAMDEGEQKDVEERDRKFWVWNSGIEEELMGMMPSDMENQEKADALDVVKERMWEVNFAKQHTIEAVAEAMGYDNTVEKSLVASNLWGLIDKSWMPSKTNPAASKRSKRLNSGKCVTLISKIHCPLFNTAKSLPTNMAIRISLTKNDDRFLLLAESESSQYNITIEDCYLDVTYSKPRESILQLIESKIARNPAPYTITKPELLIKPIQNAGQIIRITDIFHDKIPSHAFFCLQDSKSFEGSFVSNPFTFIPFKKFQFYMDGNPYFKEPLEVRYVEKGADSRVRYQEFGDYMRQLYTTLGKSIKGDCLVNDRNFILNFMVGMSFGADRCNLTNNHMNLQVKSSTYCEIDMGINEGIPNDMLLIIYAVHDRQIQIDQNREIVIVE